MEFNVGKCFAMRVGRQRGRSKIDPPMYILYGLVLCSTDTTKYLRLTITWHNTSSVLTMLHELSWESLARRRERARLCMIYKVVHGLVDIPWLQNKV